MRPGLPYFGTSAECKPRLSARGLTLVEILVVMALLTVVTTLVAGLISSSIRITSREALTLEIEQSCHFLLQRIESDLQSSGIAGISYLDSTEWNGVAINPVEDVTGEGNLSWQNSQIVYLWNSSKRALFKSKMDGDTNTVLTIPQVFSPSELLTIADTESSDAAQIGKGVSDFSVVNHRADGSSRVITLSIEITRLLPQEQARQFRLTKSLALLN